ncbi:Major Facilitator Superfamily protein [Streptosporangium subroseum]|uniref:Major Facilitator Superfamily protein n=1 Tax=Streptosporangium subroseum TaxID=106412 RepID=A0A239J2E1_9ACTN|nr:MFS transporter [Streptosporangium subroseum]SNS99842.1 Major Facilitator Superfamily protein [Streptosporangium subroseum]
MKPIGAGQVGTALGPSLGGVLIAGLGWRAIFLVNAPLGILTFLLAHHHLPVDQRKPKTDRAGFDTVGTLLLALTLAAYALAMTTGHGGLGPLSLALLVAAAFGVGLFVRAEARAASPLIRLGMFRDPALSASLAMSMLVSTVMMATLVVGPFYLSRTLGLDEALIGLVLSVGPLVAALTGVPAGRIADRFGAQRMTVVGLIGIAAGSLILSMRSRKISGSSNLPRGSNGRIPLTASEQISPPATDGATAEAMRLHPGPAVAQVHACVHVRPCRNVRTWIFPKSRRGTGSPCWAAKIKCSHRRPYRCSLKPVSLRVSRRGPGPARRRTGRPARCRAGGSPARRAFWSPR